MTEISYSNKNGTLFLLYFIIIGSIKIQFPSFNLEIS